MTPSEDMLHHLFGRIYFSLSNNLASQLEHEDLDCFTIDDNLLSYFGFCDDFGPMSLGTIYKFCTILDERLRQVQDRRFVILCELDARSVTNAIFLVGAYMLMRKDADIEGVIKMMDPVKHRIVSYRDVSPGTQNFNLYIEDCWSGLLKAKNLGWVKFGEDSFDAEAYAHLEDPLNADLHEIIPGKFIAMRGPKAMPQNQHWADYVCEDGSFSHREFSPTHFAEILTQFGVQAVLRLNSPEYDKQEFVNAGIAVADLAFEDCSTPPMDIIAKSLLIAESVKGPLAVHCKAGLGRTGTIIGLYMMRHYGFSAREAMGWLRIVRPGSVIGKQQDFLCKMEGTIARLARTSSVKPPPTLREGSEDIMGVESREALVAQLVRSVDEQAAKIKSASNLRKTGRGTGSVTRAALAAHVCTASNRRNNLKLRGDSSSSVALPVDRASNVDKVGCMKLQIQ